MVFLWEMLNYACSQLWPLSVTDSLLGFLHMNVGSRAVGMGGAFTSIANDASAIDDDSSENQQGISKFDFSILGSASKSSKIRYAPNDNNNNDDRKK